jgi:hypothetical protein
MNTEPSETEIRRIAQHLASAGTHNQVQFANRLLAIANDMKNHRERAYGPARDPNHELGRISAEDLARRSGLIN